MKEMSWRGRSNVSAAGESGSEGASWGWDARRDGEWGEWQQWDGVWWIRVGHSNLNSRQRRQVSRGLER